LGRSKCYKDLYTYFQAIFNLIYGSLAIAMQRIAISQVVSHFSPYGIDDPNIKTREYVSVLLDSPLSVEMAWDPVL